MGCPKSGSDVSQTQKQIKKAEWGEMGLARKSEAQMMTGLAPQGVKNIFPDLPPGLPAAPPPQGPLLTTFKVHQFQRGSLDMKRQTVFGNSKSGFQSGHHQGPTGCMALASSLGALVTRPLGVWVRIVWVHVCEGQMHSGSQGPRFLTLSDSLPHTHTHPPFVPLSVRQPKINPLWVHLQQELAGWHPLQSKQEGVPARGGFESHVVHILVHMQLGQDLCPLSPILQKPHDYVPQLPGCGQLLSWQPAPTDNCFRKASEEEPARLPYTRSSNCQTARRY